MLSAHFSRLAGRVATTLLGYWQKEAGEEVAMLFRGQCHFPLHQDSLSTAREIIDPKLLQSQAIENWDGDVSSCSGEEGKQAGEQR